MTDVMTGAEKIAFVSQQIADVRSGESNKLFCPYCQGKNRSGETFCCDLMTKCVTAILEHEQVVNEVKLQEAIAEACVHGISN